MSPRTRLASTPLSASTLRRVPGTALLLHALLSLLLQLGWSLLPDAWGWFSKSSLTGYVLSIILMQGLCVLLPAFLTIWLFRLPAGLVTGRGTSDAARNGNRTGTLLLAFTLGIPVAVMLLSINNSLVYLLARTGLVLPLPILPGVFPTTSLEVRVLLSLTVGLLPALTEEILFRGVLQPAMTAFGNRTAAIWMSAAAFAVFHADPLFIVAPLGAGLFLGYIRLKTDNLLPCVATHFALNLTLLWIQPLLPRLTGISFTGAGPAESVLYASLVAFSISSAVAIPLTLLLGGHKRADTAEKRPARRILFPVDWKFWLAMLMLVVTITVGFLTAS